MTPVLAVIALSASAGALILAAGLDLRAWLAERHRRAQESRALHRRCLAHQAILARERAAHRPMAAILADLRRTKHRQLALETGRGR